MWILAISYFHLWPESYSTFPLQNELTPIGHAKFYDLWSYGVLVYFLVVIVVNLRIVYSYQIYTFWGELLIFISIIFFVLIVLIYSQITSFQNDIYQMLDLYLDFNVVLKALFSIFAFPLLDIMAGLTVGLIRDDQRPDSMDLQEFSNLSDPYLTRRQFRRSTIFSQHSKMRSTLQL